MQVSGPLKADNYLPFFLPSFVLVVAGAVVERRFKVPLGLPLPLRVRVTVRDKRRFARKIKKFKGQKWSR